MLSSCRRIALISFLVLAAVLSSLGEAPAPQPSAKQIAQWIEQLGDNDFQVRENASKKLWQAGAAAESALESASKSDDPEVVRRARDLLDKFRWGIYPDTPADIVALIRAYQSSEGKARTEILQKLLHGGDAGLRAVLKIAQNRKDENERRLLRDLVSRQVPASFLQAVMEEKYTNFEKLLEIGHEGKLVGAKVYAAYWLLRGKLAERIAQFRSRLSEHPDDTWAAQTLTYLHRANGDLVEARKAAEKSGRPDLLEGILYEAADWKALSARAESAKPDTPSARGIYHIVGEDNPAEKWAYRAAFARLAGKQKEFENAVRELRKFTEKREERDSLAFVAAKGLLLNDRPAEGLQLLETVEDRKGVLFDILCARLDFGKALALAETPRRAPIKMPSDLEFAKARTLCLLGEREKAEALFTGFGQHIKDDVDPYWVDRLLREENRAGLRELAFEHCAKVLSVSPRKNMASAEGAPLESAFLSEVFPQQAKEAELWWVVLRQKFKEESAAAVLKRLRELMAGKMVAKDVKSWIAEADGLLSQPAECFRAARLPVYRQALAETAAKAGLDDLTLSLLEKADTRDALLRLGDWLAARKQWAQAAERYQQAWKKELSPESPRAHFTGQPPDPLPLFLAGEALVRAGREKEGRKLMEQSHWLPLADAATRFSFLRALAKRGHAEAARRETELLLRVSEPNTLHSGVALRLQAVAALRRKEYLKAAEGSEQSMLRCLNPYTSFMSNGAYAIVPAQIHQLRASGLLAAGKLDEALQQAELALSVSPGYVDLPIALVLELERRGHPKEAAALFARCHGVYEKLCRDYPRCAWAHNSSAWLCACCCRHLDAGLRHAEKAIALAPSNAGYLDTLAEVHFQRGDKDKAIALQKRAIELDPQKAYYRKQLKRLEAGDRRAERPLENEGE